MSKNRKKTVKVATLVSKANFELLAGTHVHNGAEVALTKYEAIKDVLHSFDAYDGFNYYIETSLLSARLIHYTAKNSDVYVESSSLYTKDEFNTIIKAHEKLLERAADDFYIKTQKIVGECDLYEIGGWITFLIPYLIEENFIYLY